MNFQFPKISPNPANPSEAQIQTAQKHEVLRQSRWEFNLYCIAVLLSWGVSITSIGLLLCEKIPPHTATTAVELSTKIPYVLRKRESRKKREPLPQSTQTDKPNEPFSATSQSQPEIFTRKLTKKY